MLDNLRKDPQMMVHYRFEQNYVSSCIQGGVKFWPAAWTKFWNALSEVMALSLSEGPNSPEGCAHYYLPRTSKAVGCDRWTLELQTYLSSADGHLKWVFSERKSDPRWRRHLTRFVRPTKWVEEHWRE